MMSERYGTDGMRQLGKTQEMACSHGKEDRYVMKIDM
jgi:hypothetical protein